MINKGDIFVGTNFVKNFPTILKADEDFKPCKLYKYSWVPCKVEEQGLHLNEKTWLYKGFMYRESKFRIATDTEKIDFNNGNIYITKKIDWSQSTMPIKKNTYIKSDSIIAVKIVHKNFQKKVIRPTNGRNNIRPIDVLEMTISDHLNYRTEAESTTVSSGGSSSTKHKSFPNLGEHGYSWGVRDSYYWFTPVSGIKVFMITEQGNFYFET